MAPGATARHHPPVCEDRRVSGSGAVESWDVLVVGGGPAGAASAYWLAEAGHDVTLVERKHYPREKTCGDGLTPRSVRQLEDMDPQERDEMVRGVVREVHVRGGRARFGDIGHDGRLGGLPD